jgi:hypothetical protein
MTFQEAISKAPKANSVQVYYCESETCHRPHVVLFDKDDMPIAQFVCPDPRPDGTGFVHDLMGALYRGAVERNDGTG